jgi:ribA/ribD-fused uncharacterized protein
MAAYQIHTIQMANHRKLKDGMHLLDTTAKSGVPAFAPVFSNVMAYKDGTLSEEEYTRRYLEKMAASQVTSASIWEELLVHKQVAVACYCTPGKFCHRHLFVPIMKAYLEERGHTVELMGELGGKQYCNHIPEAIVSIPFERKIIPFYTRDHVLSNHAPIGFTVKDIHFKHGEMFLMYCKSVLMGDMETANKILVTDNPQACKMLGKRVKPWDEQKWLLKRRGISNRLCYEKAVQNPEVDEYLLGTNNDILVEASPSDVIWGVGIAENDPRIFDVNEWQGLNLLGESWMWARRKRQEDVIF